VYLSSLRVRGSLVLELVLEIHLALKAPTSIRDIVNQHIGHLPHRRDAFGFHHGIGDFFDRNRSVPLLG